jgi:hypothetical protein
MEMAQDIFRRLLAGTPYRIESRVVFMPTDAGMGSLHGVTWPGNIPAVYLPMFLQELAQEQPFDVGQDHSWMSSSLANLVK